MSAAVVLGLLAAGCARGPELSDTGYEGTWRRGSGTVESRIAIVKDGDGYRFRWKLDSDDGRWTVRCNWDGACEEFVDGRKTSEYTFRTWVQPSGFLRVECKGKITWPKPHEVHYVDQLRVKKGGLVLRASTLEQHGEDFFQRGKPKRVYTKVSNAVEDPPPGWKPSS